MRYLRLSVYSGVIANLYLYGMFVIGGILTQWDSDYVTGVSVSTPFFWEASFYLLFPDIVMMCIVGFFVCIFHGLLIGLFIGVIAQLLPNSPLKDKVDAGIYKVPVVGGALSIIAKFRYGKSGLITGLIAAIYVFLYEFIYPQNFSFATFSMPVLGVNPLSGHDGILWYFISTIYCFLLGFVVAVTVDVVMRKRARDGKN